ncbi:site-specific integrase [Brucella sp. 10RB9215]|uniref:site-specific integrase n=1 Tax=Brucella sp. 10RB9215 TaxID=1149953 RepID=UPI0010FE8D62
MSVEERAGAFRTDFRVNGERYRSTFNTREEAEAWEASTRAALKTGKPLPKAQTGRSESGHSLSQLGQLFEHTKKYHWQNNPKIKHPDTAIAAAKASVEYFGTEKLVKEIDTDAMKEFVRYMVADGLTYATADRKLAGLSTMLRIAHEKGVIPRKPKIPLSGEVNERIRFLTKEEAQRILKLWQEWHQPDLYNFTVFALHTGARKNAILDLRWNAFSPGYRTVIFWGGDKKSKARTLPLSKAAIAAVEAMRRAYPEGRGPFYHLKGEGRDTKMREKWDLMRKHLGFDDVVIHTLRHTCASWMVQAGVDLKRVQTWLGHKSIETTLIYAKLGTGDLDVCSDILGGMLDTPIPEQKAAYGAGGGSRTPTPLGA